MVEITTLPPLGLSEFFGTPVMKTYMVDLREALSPVPVPKNASLRNKNQIRKANRRKRHAVEEVMRQLE